DGRLVENIMFFARALRAAGMPVGPGKVIEAIRAVETVGIANRGDFYWALHAVFVNRRDQKELFDQAFHVFWRNPQFLERMMQMMLPALRAPADEETHDELMRRLAEALHPDRAGRGDGEAPPPEEVQIDASLTWSAREVLQKMDFEKMSAQELAAAKRAIAEMRLPIMALPTRRFQPHPQG